MTPATPLPSVFDTQSLSKLKGALHQNDPKALKAAAQQFEAVFLQMVLKSMRAAAPQESMMDSDQTRFYQELLDSQLAQSMAAKGGTGLAAIIEKQLSRSEAVPIPEDGSGLPLQPVPRGYRLDPASRGLPLPNPNDSPSIPLQGSPVQPAAPVSSAESPAQAFVSATLPYALAASRQTGLPPDYLVAHAALESGWGRAEPRFADGSPSYNLFGIKAGSNWQGRVVETTTTEYVNGVAEKRTERFRAYGSYAESFEDYARLLAGSPRYAEVLGSRDPASFARGLQRAGYATDPAYAAKLERIISGPALRQALIG